MVANAMFAPYVGEKSMTSQDNDIPASYASPPCFMHELDQSYVGLASEPGAQQQRDVARWRKAERDRLIAERLARECTDHLIVVNEEHLRRILVKFTAYYNHARTHTSLGKDAPYTRPIERFGHVVAHPILGGLHHRYARI